MIDTIIHWIHSQFSNNNFFNAVIGGFVLTGLTFIGKFLWERFKLLFIVELLFADQRAVSLAIENLLLIKPHLINKYARGCIMDFDNISGVNNRLSLTFNKPYIFWISGGICIMSHSRSIVKDSNSNWMDITLSVFRINITTYLTTLELNNLFLKPLKHTYSNVQLRIGNGIGYTAIMIDRRDISSLFIDSTIKNNVVFNLESFIKIETKLTYKRLGIPYKYGILLYGKPGCGKSSLIHCMASKINFSITNINLNDFKSNCDLLSWVMNNVYEDTFLVIEDIDDLPTLYDREKYSISDLNKKDGITLSSVLQLLDGFIIHDSVIICLTTNHPEKLDTALLRDGRIDLRIELDYINRDLVSDMIKYWFEDKSEEWVENVLNEFDYPAVPAKVHNRCLELLKHS